MSKAMRALVLALAAVVSAGCAGFAMQNIGSAKDEEEARGFRYYETAPFFLVHTDSKGGLTAKVVYLPDAGSPRSRTR